MKELKQVVENKLCANCGKEFKGNEGVQLCFWDPKRFVHIKDCDKL